MAGNQEDIKVGQKVVILGKRKGIVKFLGQTAFGPGEWVGIELDKPTGTHDGLANGHRYFTCPAGHGVYVQRQGVLPSTSWTVSRHPVHSAIHHLTPASENTKLPAAVDHVLPSSCSTLHAQ